MSKYNRKSATYEEVAEAISKHKTMGGSAISLGIDRRTFYKIASEYGLYHGDARGGKKFDLLDILAGKHPQYPTSKLSKRLVKEGYKKYECQSCGISDWNGKPISLELNHIDGNSGNHALENLELICPNCHSQTDTYRSKKLKITNLEGRAHGAQADLKSVPLGPTLGEGSIPLPSATRRGRSYAHVGELVDPPA